MTVRVGVGSSMLVMDSSTSDVTDELLYMSRLLLSYCYMNAKARCSPVLPGCYRQRAQIRGTLRRMYLAQANFEDTAVCA